MQISSAWTLPRTARAHYLCGCNTVCWPINLPRWARTFLTLFQLFQWLRQLVRKKSAKNKKDMLLEPCMCVLYTCTLLWTQAKTMRAPPILLLQGVPLTCATAHSSKRRWLWVVAMLHFNCFCWKKEKVQNRDYSYSLAGFPFCLRMSSLESWRV